MSSIFWFARSPVARGPAADGARPHAADPQFMLHMIAELEQRLSAVEAGAASDTTLLEPVVTLARDAQKHGFSDRLLAKLDASSKPALRTLADVLAEHFENPSASSAGALFVAQIAATLPAPPRQILKPEDAEQLGAWLMRPPPRAWDAQRSLTALQARAHSTHAVTAAFVDAMDSAAAPASARLAVNVAVEACARAINAAPQRGDLFTCATATIAVWFAAAELFHRGERASAADLVATHVKALRAAGLPPTVAAGSLPARIQADALAASGQAALARLRLVRTEATALP